MEEVGKSRSDADIRGLKFYYTGKKCKHGHLSKRRTSDAHCMECVAIYYRTHKSRIGAEYKKYYDDNRDKILTQKRKYRSENSHISRIYEEKNRERISENAKRRYTENHSVRLSKNIRASIYNSLKANRSIGLFRHVGYSIFDLVTHLEKQFTKGMTWGSYGDWHIDHILPISSFEISGVDCDEFKACWALSNLRPLWAEDNIKKSNKIQHLI